jgi:hypothetical protein
VMTGLADLDTKRVFLKYVLQMSSNRPTARRFAWADRSIFQAAVNTLATSFD